MNIPQFTAHVASKLLRVTHTDHFVGDKQYISLFYRMMTGEKMHWNNPQTFTEKLQWLKVYLRDERMPLLVDKVVVKEYVGNLIGNEYIISTIGGGK